MLSMNCRMSQKWANLFLKNTFARFGDCRIIQSCILLLVCFSPISFLEITIPCMVSRACVPKSSANHLAPHVFSQKCFVDLIFGHRFLSIFSGIFRVLCKVISKYNKINLCINPCNSESIMVTKKSGGKNVIFWRKKKLRKRHQMVHSLVEMLSITMITK